MVVSQLFSIVVKEFHLVGCIFLKCVLIAITLPALQLLPNISEMKARQTELALSMGDPGTHE